jgi:pimeloyl-ACP methyl ester carboxylesterase
VLVGHSAGGWNLRLFASRYPSVVAGLVLVDSPHEDMIDAWRSVLPPETWVRLIGPMSYEGGDYIATRAQLAAAAPLHDVPLVVLTARHGTYPYGWPREALDAVRVPMQGKLAGLTPQGRQIIVDDTGHEIQRDRPDLVVEAIRHVIAQGWS